MLQWFYTSEPFWNHSRTHVRKSQKFGYPNLLQIDCQIALRILACLMLAPQCHTVCSHTNISPTRCSRLHVFACVLICISHSLTHHFKNQRRVDLPLNSHQPGAKPLRANGDPVHTDMLVPQRRVMEPAAPLFSAARHAAKTMELCCFLLSCVKCSG